MIAPGLVPLPIVLPTTPQQKVANQQLADVIWNSWQSYADPALTAAGNLLYGAGLGERIYDITHPAPKKTIESTGMPWQPISRGCGPDPGDRFKMCLNFCRATWAGKPFKRALCYAACGWGEFWDSIGGMGK